VLILLKLEVKWATNKAAPAPAGMGSSAPGMHHNGPENGPTFKEEDWA